MVWEGRWLPFSRLEASPCLLGSLLVVDKQNPNPCGKDAVSANPVVSSFFARAFVPNLCDLIQSFSSQPLLLHEWPPNPIPLRGQKDPEEMRVLGSAPSHSPSWSLARKLLPSHPNTKYCLGIHVTLTEETGAAPPPPHTWTAPMVEDMLCHGRTGLTEAIVMGPGRAVLFYGRQSLGEGLSLGEVRDTAFTPTGTYTWVGKPAYPAADPLTIQEGQLIITQSIIECQIEVRGPGWPQLHLINPATVQIPLSRRWSQKDHPRMPVLTINHYPTGCREVRITIVVERIRG